MLRLIKKIKRRQKKKRNVKRSYVKKKLFVNVNSDKQRNKKLFYNVKYVKKLIERLKSQRRRNEHKKERPIVVKRNRINKPKLLLH